MKNTFKKLLSVLLCAVLLFTTASVALAADETRTVVDSGFCGAQGENLTWTLYSDGELVISGEGDMDWYDVFTGSKPKLTPWNDHYNKIDVITVEEGITGIGLNAFLPEAGEYSKYYRINLPKSLIYIEYRTSDDAESSRVPGQHLAYCYAGSESEWSKIEKRKISVSCKDGIPVDSVVVSVSWGGQPQGPFEKLYFNGKEPETFCEFYTKGYQGIDIIAHFYSAEAEAAKLVWHSIHNGREKKVGEMLVGEYDVDGFIIPTHITGKHELRVDVVDAKGKTIVSSENFLLSNVPSLGQRIKSFFETFAYMANLLGYLISMSIASDLAVIRNWFAGLFN